MENYEEDSIGSRRNVTLFKKNDAFSRTEIFIYLEEDDEYDEIVFNVEYSTEYKDGTFNYGNGFGRLDEILKSYQFNDPEQILLYFKQRYDNDEKAFKKIVEDIKNKGINLSVDEAEGGPL